MRFARKATATSPRRRAQIPERGGNRRRRAIPIKLTARAYATAGAAALPARRSKNSARLIVARTVSALNGLVMRNAGSGYSPVSKRSGYAVMKITGTLIDVKISLTAAKPELPSAR